MNLSLVLLLGTFVVQGPFRQVPRELDPRSAARVGELVPDVEMGSKRLTEAMGPKGLVVVVRRDGCPVAERYAPTLAGLEAVYRERGISFLTLDVSAPEATAFARELDAVTSPEAFLFDRARTLRYRGAIDDQYGIGYSKHAPAADYLVDALEAVLAGEDVAVEATSAPGCVLGAEAASPPELGTITYHNRVSRILQRHCQECHREGGAGPFVLESYEDAKGFAPMMAFVVANGIMPPWFANPETGHWANDRSLSERERNALLSWVENGAAEGNAEDAPLQRRWAFGWSIGEPDAVFEIPEPIEVPAEGVVDYQYVYVKTDFPEDRWVQKMEILPTAPKVTHHVLVFLEEPGRKSFDDETRKPDEPFFQGGLSGYFSSTVPGQQPAIYPSGMAKLLPKGAWLKFQLHYTPNGERAVDRTRIGFVFADEPPRTPVRTGSAADTDFEIPPGAPHHEVPASFRFEKDAVLLSFFPHMHLRGKAYRYELLYPDGRSEVLLDVPRYDFNWQLHYQFDEPLAVPAGSVLKATGWFDNSPENPANPDSTLVVRFGEQSFEEMMIGYFDYYLP
jgi:mono/diheme cytochrome c family protein